MFGPWMLAIVILCAHLGLCSVGNISSDRCLRNSGQLDCSIHLISYFIAPWSRAVGEFEVVQNFKLLISLLVLFNGFYSRTFCLLFYFILYTSLDYVNDFIVVKFYNSFIHNVFFYWLVKDITAYIISLYF